MMCERDDEQIVLNQMEVQVEKSKLSVEVAKKLVQNLRKNKISHVDLFEIVLVDDDALLCYILSEFCVSRNIKVQEIVNCLSLVYDKTILVNVNAPICVEVMEAYLVDYQYSREANGGIVESPMKKIDGSKRLLIINKCVDSILSSSKPEDYYQCDDKFLFLLRSISKHLFLLGSNEKNHLKEVDNILYCLNVFYLSLRDKNEMLICINKITILEILGRLQKMLRPMNKDHNKKLLESYCEVTQNGINMHGFRKKVELSWRIKTNIAPRDISFGELMKKLDDILNLKIITQKELDSVKRSVSKKLENPADKTKSFVKDLKNIDANRQLLTAFFEISNCGNKRNPITKYILSAHERDILSPFDEMALKVNFLLQGNSPLSSEIESIRDNVRKTLTEPPKHKWYRNVADKKFFRKLECYAFNHKHQSSLNLIFNYIKLIENIDIEEYPITGPLAIRRAVHVIGELTKFTGNTKSISAKLSSSLKSVHDSFEPNLTANIRNMLSHNHSLYRIRHLENFRPSDYKKLQDELKSLKFILQPLLVSYLNISSVQFFSTLYSCKNKDQVMPLMEYVNKGIKTPILEDTMHIVNILTELQNKIQYISMNPNPEIHSKLSWVFENIGTLCELMGQERDTSVRAFELYAEIFNMGVKSLDVLKSYCKNIMRAHTNYKPHLQTAFVRLIYHMIQNIELEYADNKLLCAQLQHCRAIIDNCLKYLQKINNLDQELDEHENNPLLELRNWDYLDEIYAHLGLNQIELKKHEKKYPEEFKEVMSTLQKNISIFKITVKFAALVKYFNNIGLSVDTELEVLRIAEIEEVQQIFEDKIFLLGHFPKEDPCAEMAYEMLILEILELMNESVLQDNLQQLDERGPVLCGRNLRNYIGHKNNTYEVIAYNMKSRSSCLEKNATAIYKRKGQLKLFDRPTAKLPAHTIEKNDFDVDLLMIEKQRQLYESIKVINFDSFRAAIQNGAIIQGRNYSNQHVYEILLNHYLEILCPNIMSELVSAEVNEFLKNFRESIPQRFLEEFDYNHKKYKLLTIHQEALEAIKRGERNKIEKEDILPLACTYGVLETVKLIIEHEDDNDFNQLNSDGFTPLMFAFISGSVKVIELLLNRIESIELNKAFCCLLAKTNDLQIFKLVIPKCHDINKMFDPECQTLLRWCITLHCGSEIIYYLIEQGAERTEEEHVMPYNRLDLYRDYINEGLIDSTSEYDSLYWACYEGKIGIVRLLIESKIPFQNIILYFAAAINGVYTDIVVLLMKHYREEFNQISEDGMVSIFSSVLATKNLRLIELFQNKGIFDQETYIQILCRSIMLNNYKLFKRIFDFRADWIQTSPLLKSGTLLKYAVCEGNLQVVQEFIKLGYDYPPKNKYPYPNGMTWLHDAMQSNFNNYEVIEYLLSLSRGDVNATDNEGATALFYAVRRAKLRETYILLKYDANINLKLKDGYTVLHDACSKGDIQMIKLLMRFGAAAQIGCRTMNFPSLSPIDIAYQEEHYHLGPYLEKQQLDYLIDAVQNNRIKFNSYFERFLYDIPLRNWMILSETNQLLGLTNSKKD